jgi:hypothetical protein
MKLSLDNIRLDGGTQPRAELHDDVIADYAELMAAGVKFPPVIVFFDGEQYWLADGFHRVQAARRFAPEQPIDAKVHQGAVSDAQWYSYGVNQKHGLRRTNEDKARAVRAALTHPKSSHLSDTAIADHVGVARMTVLRHRQEVKSPEPGGDERLAESDLSQSYKSPIRTGRDGRTINTAQIGRKGSRRLSSRRTSSKALEPIRGLSSPCPMIPVQFSPNNAQTAAATLWQRFPRTFIEQLVQELSQRLVEGETQ